jgi:hypothetical protein
MAECYGTILLQQHLTKCAYAFDYSKGCIV